jgi:hypothetical protein
MAGWLALPGYMAEVWQPPPWPENASRADLRAATYGTPSWGTAPFIDVQPAAYRIDDALAQAEADFRRIEAETERDMARDRDRFARLQALYAEGPGPTSDGLQKAALTQSGVSPSGPDEGPASPGSPDSGPVTP